MVNSVNVLLGENFFLPDQLQVIVSCEDRGNEVAGPSRPLVPQPGILSKTTAKRYEKVRELKRMGARFFSS